MKRFSITLIALTLVSCGGGSGGGNQPPDLGTAPQISNLSLSSTSVNYMQGDGIANISGTLDFVDPDLDIATIRVAVSDGTSLQIPIPGPITAAAGTIVGELTVSTTELGLFSAEVWIVDRAGNNSNRLAVEFSVVVDATTWFERASGLSQELNAVAWNGSIFVAVGNGGTILTSSDGLDWIVQTSGTDVRLNAIAWDGSKFFVVGDAATILTSTDGANWNIVNSGDANVWLRAIAFDGTRIIAAGKTYGPNTAYMTSSLDGQAWTENATVPQTGRSITDIAWSGQQFVASTLVESFPNDGRILTSVDGLTWVEIVISAESLSTISVIWDGNQFVAGGVVGRLHTSPDGVNWSELNTPVSTNFFCVASSGMAFVAHGNGRGVATTDGGASWQTFSMAIGYTGKGVVWGNSRFVSVGYIGPGLGGAIFTTR